MAMNERTVAGILRTIEAKYPSGKRKVSPSFVSDVIGELARATLPHLNPRRRDELSFEFHGLIQKSRKGLNFTTIFDGSADWPKV
jgi:hypothetical protein